MPDNDELKKFYSPEVPESEPEPEPEEELVEEEEQEQEQSDKLRWIGSPKATKAEDGISDLFDPGTESDTEDVVKVDIEQDIIDTNPETGDLSDLVEVSEEDILGDEETDQIPLNYKPDVPRSYRTTPRTRRFTRRRPPMSGMQGIGR